MKIVDFFTVTLDDTELRYVYVKGIPYFLYNDIKDFIGITYEKITYLNSKLGSEGCIKTCVPIKSGGVVVSVVSPQWIFRVINWRKKFDMKHAIMLKDYYQNTYGVLCDITNSPIKTCVVCGKTIPDSRMRGNVKCCSPECKRKYSREYQRKYQHLLWFSKKEDKSTTKTCLWCGKEFDAINDTQRFCSRSCCNKASWQRTKERKALLKNGGFYNPKYVYSSNSAEHIEWDDEHVDAYLRRLHAWEWGLVKDDLKTWID